MALASLQKLYLVYLPQHREKILRILQKTNLLHIVTAEKELHVNTQIENNLPLQEAQKQLTRIDAHLSHLQWMIEHLEKFRQRHNVLEHFVTPRQVVSFTEFQNIARFDETPIYNTIKHIEEQEHLLQKRIRKYYHLLEWLQQIDHVPIPLSLFSDTEHTLIRLYRAEIGGSEELRQALKAQVGELHEVVPISRKGRKQIVLVIVWKDPELDIDQLEENLSLERIHVEGLTGTPAEEIIRLSHDINEAEKQLAELHQQLTNLSVQLEQLQLAYDYWQSERERLLQFSRLARSQFTEVIIGWVRQRDIPRLEEQLRTLGFPLGWEFTDPRPDELPPADFDNPPVVEPFEFVTDLYSRPRYWELDPTPFLSAFFALFFGICLTDAGYGLILSLITGLALKKVTFATENSRKLVKILFYSGLITTGVGLFTGGIFGLSFQQLPGPLAGLHHLVLLNPLENQIGFLAFALTLGIIHVGLGIFLKFYRNLQDGQAAEAWLDQAPWMAILLGVLVLGVASQVDSAWISPLGYGLMALAALTILLFAGRGSRNSLVRFLKGLYALYQVSGLMGDILSYARLFALGLATGVIAGVVNFLAKLTLGIPYLGLVFMPLILIGGHLMNLVINALGGFIHTARLQYVEFFGKFYEGGGEPFQPFGMKLNYTKIKEQR